jgi:hypothetical protein
MLFETCLATYQSTCSPCMLPYMQEKQACHPRLPSSTPTYLDAICTACTHLSLCTARCTLGVDEAQHTREIPTELSRYLRRHGMEQHSHEANVRVLPLPLQALYLGVISRAVVFIKYHPRNLPYSPVMPHMGQVQHEPAYTPLEGSLVLQCSRHQYP